MFGKVKPAEAAARSAENKNFIACCVCVIGDRTDKKRLQRNFSRAVLQFWASTKFIRLAKAVLSLIRYNT
jgi:hypothetical protein